MTTLFSRTDQSILGRWWWTVDRTLLAAALGLMLIGIMLVATASPPVALRIAGTGHDYMFVKKQLLFLALSIPIMFGMSLLSPRDIWRVCSIALVACVIGMVVVLFAGEEIKGARRWIDILHVSLQPSEFAKPCFAIVSAWLIAKKKNQPSLAFPAYEFAVGLFALMLLLLLLQPDFGMSFVVTCMFFAQLFLAGLPLMLVGGLTGLGAVGVALAYLFSPHVHVRINKFFHHDSTDNYQVDKAVDAFRHGGIFGTGLGQGTVKLNLPDAHADTIFAVAGEELGMILTCLIVLLYGFVILRGLNRAMDSNDMFVVLAASGLLTMFGLQAFVNMGSSVHLLPTKGMTLPFISYGGSSLIAIGFSMGIILALTRRQIQTGIARGSRFYRRGVHTSISS
jgi:cell division protein FtsW